MSGSRESNSPHLGFLLLRDGHAVPLAGISPDEIKAGAKCRVPHPAAEPILHRQTLNAIVDRLGFRGDFGDFKNIGFDAFNAFLHENGCGQQASLFPPKTNGSINLYFGGVLGPKRRQLADRIFEAGGRTPERVFLGHGIDWANTWDSYRSECRPRVIATVGGDPTTAARRADAMFDRRHDLSSGWGFLDDRLIWGPLESVIDKAYWLPDASELKRKANHEEVVAAVRAFRDVFDTRPEGWVDVLRYNDRLVVLRGHDGAWEVLWRAYREVEPPTWTDISRWSRLAVEDMPVGLIGVSDLNRAAYFRQDVWDEREAHDAEQAFYDRGGLPRDRGQSSDAEVRIAWLREQGQWPVAARTPWTGDVPPGFRLVEVAGRRLAVSDLVEVASFRQMASETGYLGRRADNREPWERANDGDAATAPVGANWSDAQAFCAWREHQLGVGLRLPTRDELNAIRSFDSEHYARMGGRNVHWENFRPPPLAEGSGDSSEQRIDVPSAVVWSEPRFVEPATDLPEFPLSGDSGDKSQQRLSVNSTPHARWRDDLPWASESGLRFIDAWDAGEWCQEPDWVHGRFWSGRIGRDSWGAYKSLKVTFRLVLDLED